MSMQCADFAGEMKTQSHAMVSLTQLEVQLLADKIIEEIFGLKQKRVSKKRIVEMVAGELQKMGILSREDESLEAGGRRNCTPDL